MPARQLQGRAAIAALVAKQPLTLAWGRGLPAWDAKPTPEGDSATKLHDEVGRRIVTQIGFVVPDDAGEIETADRQRWRLQTEPTRNLYVRTQYRYDEAVGEKIREIGLFVGAEFVPGLPAGQRYYTPEQITQPGTLLTLSHLPAAVVRDGLTNYSFELVTVF